MDTREQTRTTPSSGPLAPASSSLRGQAAIESSRGSTARVLRGQAAIELLVLAGFSIAFILPLVFLFMSSSNSELGKTALSQAKITTRTIADEAGEIYLQGAGAKRTILVNYPTGVMNGSVENGIVVLTIDADGRRTDVLSSTFAAVKGNLSGRKNVGLQRIKMENMGDYVNITYG